MALVAKISGLGQYCTRHSNGGAGSVMSSSFDNPGDFRGSVLAQESPVNNAGQLAGTIINNVYQGIAGRTVSEPDLLAAEELLSRLPEAAVPAPATLPARSWMRVPRNPLFVGRHDDLLALARIVKLGEVAAVGRLQRRQAGRYRQDPARRRVCALLRPILLWRCVLAQLRRGGQRGRRGCTVRWFGRTAAPRRLCRVAAAGAARTGVGRLVQSLPRPLVFDNCEDPTLLQQWQPPHGGAGSC
jgi:hypothetical protein